MTPNQLTKMLKVGLYLPFDETTYSCYRWRFLHYQVPYLPLSLIVQSYENSGPLKMWWSVMGLFEGLSPKRKHVGWCCSGRSPLLPLERRLNNRAVRGAHLVAPNGLAYTWPLGMFPMLFHFLFVKCPSFGTLLSNTMPALQCHVLITSVTLL